jgi:hypothetical protein
MSRGAPRIEESMVVSLRCPHCLAPIPASAARCPICGGDPRAASAPVAAGSAKLAPRLSLALDERHHSSLSGRWYLAAAGALALVALLVGGLLVLGALAAQAGLGQVAWPALIGVGAVVALGALLQVERRRRTLAQLVGPGALGDAPSDLDLIHLFAGRFAPAVAGRGAFHPPLARVAVDASEAAWRAVGATLLDLAEGDVLELESHALPTPGEPVAVVAVRLVRPLPPGDAFAARLLHPLTRRGVGASTTVGELVGHLIMAQRYPARALLESARGHLTALGFYRPAGATARGALIVPLGWLRAALFRPLTPNAARLETARPALDALEERLTVWDTREPEVVAALRNEVLAAFRRARSRARRGMA